MAPSGKSSAAVGRVVPAKKSRKGKKSAAADDEMWALLDAAGLGHDVGFMMRIAQLALLEYVAPRLKDLDVTSSQRTIMRLIDAQPAMTQQRIADALRIKRANLTPLINELVALGLVSRESSAESRRAYAVHLTAKGKRSLKSTDKAISGWHCGDEELLDKAEQEQLIRLLKKIAAGRSSPGDTD